MTKEMLVPSEQKNQLQRASFEVVNSTSNAVFILSHHLSDNDSNFLESDIWKNMMSRVEECKFNLMKTYWVVASTLIDDVRSDTKYAYESNYDVLEYQIDA